MNLTETMQDGTAPKLTGLVVSGWAGRSGLREFRPDDDGRADFVLRLVERMQQLGLFVSNDPNRFGPADPPAFELHIESQWARFASAKRYLLLIEDRHIRPQNYVVNWAKYRQVHTWDDDIVAGHGALKYLFPAHVTPGPVGDFAQRPIFMSLVAANKAQAVATRDDLYCERVRTLQWFQDHAPSELHLYGPGWNLPIHWSGLSAKFAFKFLKKSGLFKHRSRACWKGIAPVKRDVLLRSRFNLCYENTKGSKGYISEKLFDALSTGAVPVYWGAPNVADHIPTDCFIDRRHFSSNEALYNHLSAMTPQTHREYQLAMHRFCANEGQRFNIDAFASTVANALRDDLLQTKP
jgi:alpha(1,3/1,4) fucosyltransferase